MRTRIRTGGWMRGLTPCIALLSCCLMASNLNAQQTQPPQDATRQQDNQDKAAQQGQSRTATHVGKVVSARDNTLTMTANGENHAHQVGAETKITIDRQPATLADLKPGDHIEVTTPSDNPRKALAISAIRGAQGGTVREGNNQAGNNPANERQPRPLQREANSNNQAEDRQQSPKAILGVALGRFDDPREFRRDGDNQRGGIVVTDVMESGPADQANLRAGDRLVSINGTQLNDPEQLMRLIDSMRPGQEVEPVRNKDMMFKKYLAKFAVSSLLLASEAFGVQGHANTRSFEVGPFTWLVDFAR